MNEAAAKRIPRRVGIVVGFVALAALPALGLGAFAAADAGAGTTSGEGGTRPPRPALTDAQTQCLADQGVTLPQRPANGEDQRPSSPTDEQRAAFRQAAVACGLPTPPAGAPGSGGRGAMRPRLTDAEKQCLADHGVTLPSRPGTGGEAGERPAPPTTEQRAAMQQAAAACGIALPEHGPRNAGSAQGAAV